MPLIRKIILFGIWILASCGSRSRDSAVEFHRLLPDTSKSWAGRMTQRDFVLTRRVEKVFGLQTLTNGSASPELRIWNLPSNYDPQSLTILRRVNSEQWTLRTVSYYRSRGDSIIEDYERSFSSAAVSQIELDEFWLMPSQSELKNGDSFGCHDGSDVFIELADSVRYRFMWYLCPDINKGKDRVFQLASELENRLHLIPARR